MNSQVELSHKLRHFFSTASRFGTIGLIATFIHMAIVWVSMTFNDTSPYLANLYGFLTAFIFSFLGHYFFSFQKPGKFLKSLKRFFIIAISAFLINNLVLALLLRLEVIHPIVATLVSIFIIPMITFVSSFFWGFKNK